MKILLFDIENSPIVTWSWGIHNDGMHSTKFVKEDWYIMCWAAKWLDSKKIISSALPDFKYDHNKPNDKKVCKALWKLLDEADVVVAHNGNRFDRKKANARFMIHGMKPPSPYKMVDTLTIARSNCMFTSNKLGDLGDYFGVGSKIDTGGFDLWIDCMEGKKYAWNKMVKYCIQDVVLLEAVYLKLLPYIKNHPNQNMYNSTLAGCPKCPAEYESLIKRGWTHTLSGKKRRYQCKECGGWCTDGKIIKNA